MLVTDDGEEEEVRFRGDPLDLVVEEWSAGVEGRSLDHPLAPYLERGLKLKHPERHRPVVADAGRRGPWGGVVSLKGRMRRLERLAERDVVSIPQRDGTVRRFPASDLKAAFSNLTDRLGAGENAPPEHPLIEAVRNSDDPRWTGAFYAAGDPDEWVKEVPDLSE